jgi:hypothetical protein
MIPSNHRSLSTYCCRGVGFGSTWKTRLSISAGGWDAEGNRAWPTAEKRDGITVLKMRSDLLPRSFDQMAKRRPGEQHLDNARHAAALVTTNDRLGHAPDDCALEQLAMAVVAA